MTDTQEKIQAALNRLQEMMPLIGFTEEEENTIRTVLQSALERETNKAEVDLTKEAVEYMKPHDRWTHPGDKAVGMISVLDFAAHIAQHYTITPKKGVVK